MRTAFFLEEEEQLEVRDLKKARSEGSDHGRPPWEPMPSSWLQATTIWKERRGDVEGEEDAIAAELEAFRRHRL